jgi:predicted ATPase
MREEHAGLAPALPLRHRFTGPGYVPDGRAGDATVFSSALHLIAILDAVRVAGGQVICATHSPVLAALPRAQIIQLDEDGLHETTWGALAVVDHSRRFLANPDVYLRHALSTE